MNKKFWQGKKVFITGHTGFKGSWLSLWLQTLGAEITGYALSPPTTPNLFTLADVAKNMKSMIGDIRDYASFEQALNNCCPEIVIHLAAQPIVLYSYQHPLETYQTNVMGTVNLFEAVKKIKSVTVIVNVTSDKCYENNESKTGYKEEDKLGGFDPYSNSKACSELITQAYRHSFFNTQNNQPTVGVASARAGNVIGGGDWAQNRLIPDIIRAGLFNEPLMIRSPHACRPWQHVLEPLSGYLLLAERLYENATQYQGAWNFGPSENEAKSVKWVTDFILKYWKMPIPQYIEEPNHFYEANYLQLNCKKAKSELGWNPKWNLEKSLFETVDWYNQYRLQQNMQAKTLAQIYQFMEEPIQ